jgi:hypothetical protein
MGDTACADGCTAGGADSIAIRENAFNIVLDHLSISWGTHGNLGIAKWTGTVDPTEFAVLDCIISEGLAKPRVPYGVGVTATPVDSSTWTHARNLHAHNGNRMPWVAFGYRFSGLNNVAYNAGSISLDDGSFGFFQVIGGYNTPNAFDTVWMGNVALAGPNTHRDGRAFKVGSFTPREASLANRMYLADNSGPHMTLANQWAGVTFWQGSKGGSASEANVRSNTIPSWHSAFGYEVLPNAQVLPHVLANAGARPLDRDSVDRRVVRDVEQRTGSKIVTPNDVGGYPVLAQNRRALNVPADPHAIADAAGRTRVEAWLESFARALEPARRGSGIKLSTPGNVRQTQ